MGEWISCVSSWIQPDLTLSWKLQSPNKLPFLIKAIRVGVPREPKPSPVLLL